MKRFIIQSTIFIFFCLSVALAAEYAYYRYGDWRKTIDGWEVYRAIQNSLTRQSKKKLLIGDSVGMQLFPCDEKNDSVALCTSNQAVTAAGFYMLMKNYLETNQDSLPDQVILLVTPLSLRNNVDEFTYHYFLKPFGGCRYKQEYTPLLKERISNIPHYWNATLPFIRTSMYMEKYIPKDSCTTLVSPLAEEYLAKMDSLADSYGVQFEMRSAPVKACHQRDITCRMNDMSAYSDYIQKYFKALQYMPDSCYVDKVHFTDDVLVSLEKSYLLN